MDAMLTTVILLFAIYMIFLPEWSAFISKIAAIPSVKLWVPLLAGSWLVTRHEAWVYWILMECKLDLDQFIQYCFTFLPHYYFVLLLIRFGLLSALTLCPLWILSAISAYQRRRDPLPWMYRMPVFLWIIFVFMLTP